MYPKKGISHQFHSVHDGESSYLICVCLIAFCLFECSFCEYCLLKVNFASVISSNLHMHHSQFICHFLFQLCWVSTVSYYDFSMLISSFFGKYLDFLPVLFNI